MVKTIIMLILALSAPKLLFSQTGTWERIDTGNGHIGIAGKRLFVQFYAPLTNIITRTTYSDDNGNSWQLIKNQFNVPPDLRKIVYHQNYILASGYDYIPDPGERPILFRSFDQGITWDTLSLPKQFYNRSKDFIMHGIAVQDSNIFIALSRVIPSSSGGFTYYSGVVIRSIKNETMWDTSYIESTFSQLDKPHLSNTPKTMLLINGEKKMAVFSNVSKAWRNVSGVSPNTLYKFLTSNRYHFFAINNHYLNDGSNNKYRLWRSNQEGQDWKLLLEEEKIEAFSVTDSQMVVSIPNRGVLYSSNQGETWQSLNEGTNSIGMSALGISSDGWVYGSGTIDGIGGIFRKKLPITSAVGVVQEKLQSRLAYPNPCSGTLFISLAEHDPKPLSIELSSLLGESLLRKPLEISDSHQGYTLDVSGIPIGTYLLSVRTMGGMKTELIQVMR